MYRQVLEKMPFGTTLVAVSKGRSVAEIIALYNQGQRHFGESRVQDFEKKRQELPGDIIWHFIGTLQPNKIAKIIGKTALIHSVDSLSLARKISDASIARGLVTDVLIQVNASQEATKHGFALDECRLAFPELMALPGIRIQGLMTMGPKSDDQARILSCFKATHALQKELGLPHLSMGMSQDYELALEAGATYVRIGSLLFS